MKLAEHPTVRQFHENAGNRSAPPSILDAGWLRQLCLDWLSYVTPFFSMEDTMANSSLWKLLAGTFILVGITLSGVYLYGRFGPQGPGENPVSNSRFTVDHVSVATDKPFEEVTKAIERQLGRFDPEVYKSLAAGADPEEAKAKIGAMVGPSGFMLFTTNGHGALLRIVGQKRKAIQYVLGNPLIALQMTQHDIRASLYAPLRLLVYENEEGKTCLEYDKPSSLFGQFGNEQITPTAVMLDQKMQAMVATATE
jgi:uncharacterized protein (DUF302 family)